MRLGQLARKLDLETSEIIKFLKKKDVEVENHLNTKLEDETVKMVLDAFTPEEEPEPIVEQIVEPEPKELITEEPTTVIEEKIVVEQEDITPEPIEVAEEVKPVEIVKDKEVITVSELREKEAAEAENNEERKIVELSREDTVPENIDVAIIRAPKVELQGFKVLGKIDLPESHKKESKKDSNELVERDNTTINEASDNTPLSKDGKHPNKKKLKTKAIIIPDSEIKKEEEEPQKPKKAKEIKAEKRAKEKGLKKKKSVHKIEEVSERQKIRDKRKKQREKQKDAPKKTQKNWLRQLWDAIK